MKSLAIALIFSFPLHAQILDQASCTDTDIRETNPRIKNNPELYEHFSTPRDQDSIGWCYGFSSADLMSAEIGEPVSGMHASTLYNKKIRKNIFLRLGYGIKGLFSRSHMDNVYEGGLARWALKEMIKNKRICSEKDLPFDQRYSHETLFFIRELEKLKERVHANELVQTELCQEVQSKLREFQLMSVDAEKIALSLINDNINITLDKLASENCGQNMLNVPDRLKVVSKFSPGARNKRRAKRFLQNMHKALDQGRPIEFGYNMKHFSYIKGFHSSVVMGRRWNNGRCEYRVRNSWGNTCASYKAGIDCDYETGSFWVSDEDFVKSAIQINYLKSK